MQRTPRSNVCNNNTIMVCKMSIFLLKCARAHSSHDGDVSDYIIRGITGRYLIFCATRRFTINNLLSHVI